MNISRRYVRSYIQPGDIRFFLKADLRAEDALVGGKGYLGISYHLKGLLNFHMEIDIPGRHSASTIH